MRARAGVFARVPSIHRQIGLRSLVLLPAAVVTATAMHAPAALARPSDIHWHGGSSPRFETARHVEEADDDEAEPRRRSRSHAGVRRNRDRARAASRRRAVATRSTRKSASAQKGAPRARQAAPRLAALFPAVAEIVPLEQRSLVAAHPLAPDPLFPAPELPGEPASAAALSSPPRCRGAHPNTFALAMASLGHGFRPSEPAMIEGAWPHCRGARNPQSSVRQASLGPAMPPADPAGSPSLSSGSIHWRASADCLASPLRAVLAQVAEAFGPLTVNSTCRGPGHNARVGGAPRSKHLTGHAVDFRVRGGYGEVLAFLLRQRAVGGYKHYGSGVFHIDTGQRRTWGARRARRA